MVLCLGTEWYKFRLYICRVYLQRQSAHGYNRFDLVVIVFFLNARAAFYLCVSDVHGA